MQYGKELLGKLYSYAQRYLMFYWSNNTRFKSNHGAYKELVRLQPAVDVLPEKWFVMNFCHGIFKLIQMVLAYFYRHSQTGDTIFF